MKRIIYALLIILGLWLVYLALAKYDSLSIVGSYILGVLGFVVLSLTFFTMSEHSTGKSRNIFRAIAEFFSWFIGKFQ